MPTNLSRYDYLADPVFCRQPEAVAGRMLGVNSEGYLAALDVATGGVRRVSRVAMLNGPGTWHGVTVPPPEWSLQRRSSSQSKR